MHQMPQASARKVEARFDDNSVNNSLSVTNIGDTVALHCRIWMKQVRMSFFSFSGRYFLFTVFNLI